MWSRCVSLLSLFIEILQGTFVCGPLFTLKEAKQTEAHVHTVRLLKCLYFSGTDRLSMPFLPPTGRSLCRQRAARWPRRSTATGQKAAGQRKQSRSGRRIWSWQPRLRPPAQSARGRLCVWHHPGPACLRSRGRTGWHPQRVMTGLGVEGKRERKVSREIAVVGKSWNQVDQKAGRTERCVMYHWRKVWLTEKDGVRPANLISWWARACSAGGSAWSGEEWPQ